MSTIVNLIVIATCVVMLAWLWNENRKRKNNDDNE